MEVGMKKILFVAVAAVIGVFVKKKIDEGRNEQDLWQQATDPVEKA
jgi:hypothetical protein